MSKPILYIKRGCPWCAAAIEYLDQNGVEYEAVDVRDDPDRMKELREISGQTRTPTLKWNGDVLPDFSVDDLRAFLAEHGASKS